ncbi:MULTISPECIES: amino acid permease [Sphingobium]|jgi:APA family basic amino acid/polyamine antiporter|uniref:Amino acid permease n=1 Tax=Sphingobium limneticum TaxID=1007511 RepID=A0A5J5IAB5_9SPHN|nr:MULTISPECIES: amino acid permease [Sphingobium]MBU0930922.1 amino acid permease [Alphaproteobacteria bacterium]KAA9020169.1 amino acid permease [Sphingobium limneticum]KAA9021351.1 amino acid permease [Sphingobium limneticum]KAA9033713.1 amino acid permease [Sphingobium limneticum]BBD03170.1 basic amino acid/polyamine antiporter, APA family [Sphingobium sp. YG1]
MLGPRKSIESLARRESGHSLAKTLSWPHLIALGVGAIVGTGIYTLTGVGAERAGPAVILAFAIAGAVCACAALAYAEMATLIPAAGSAYTFSYAAMGETIAWVVGWSLILEYSLACSTVAVGWSGYLVGWLQSAGIHLPAMLLVGPHGGGIINLPAVMVALAVMGMLIAGTRESATLNIILVIIKLVALSIFVAMALPAFHSTNLEPFMPYGFASTEIGGEKRGVMAAAAIVFFAFYGFDAVATSAEEAKNPGRDLTIGIIGSMLVCTVIYMGVAVAAVGALPFQQLANSPEPLALVLRQLGQPVAAHLIALAAVIALPSVILVMMYGQSRVFFVMARDGLLPRSLAKISPRTGAPTRITLITGVSIALVAGIFRLDEIAELANAGTLIAFMAVGACLMILRRRSPELPRLFRCPQPYVVGTLTILGCAYLLFSLPESTLIRFGAWNVIGLLFYYLYSRSRSGARQDAAAA